jgi:leader peptidase (prepilin peptidase) / N-methyltransferase
VLSLLGALVAWPTVLAVRVLHAQLIAGQVGDPAAVATGAVAGQTSGDEARRTQTDASGHDAPYASWEGWVAGIAVVLLWALVGLRYGLSPQAALGALACWVGAVVLPLDWRLRLIPDVVVLPAVGLAIVLRWVLDGTPLTAAAGIGTGLVFWGLIWLLGVLIYRSVSAFGLGDVKLGAFVGAVLGAQGALFAFVAGIMVGGFIAGGIILARPKQRRRPIPYGPFIVAGMLLALLASVPR